MINIQQALELEYNKRKEEFNIQIDSQEEDVIRSSYAYSHLLPRGKDVKKLSLPELRAYYKDRYTKIKDRELKKELDSVKSIWYGSDLHSCTISVEWHKSKMWGMNPRAEAEWYSDYSYGGAVSSGSISGCGYDKLSTAVADVLNKIPSVLKPFYIARENNIKDSLRDLLGYGCGYGILPCLEGGVGVGCYPRIFEKVGYKFSTVASGKTYDAFKIEKI